MSLTWKQRTSAVLGNAMEFYDIAVFASISTVSYTHLTLPTSG